MKVIEKVITLTNKDEPLSIVPLGDIHLGADGCNIEYLKNTIEWIRKTPNSYMIGLGDYLDCIIMNDKRFDIKSVDKRFLKDLDNLPLAQLKYLEKLLLPIKDKILCMIPGNHEDMFRLRNSVDIMAELRRDMEIEIGDYMTYLKIKFDSEQFHTTPITFFLHHGFFSGRKIGGKANQITDLAASYDANIYLLGHSHDLFSTSVDRLLLPNGAMNVIKEKRIFINTGTFMETTTKGGSGYAERKAYPVAKIGTARIDIYPNHRPRPDIHVRI